MTWAIIGVIAVIIVSVAIVWKLIVDVGKYKTLYKQAIDHLVANTIAHNEELDHLETTKRRDEEAFQTIGKINAGSLSVDDINALRSGRMRFQPGV